MSARRSTTAGLGRSLLRAAAMAVCLAACAAPGALETSPASPAAPRIAVAPAPPPPAQDTASLRQRAATFWAARVASDPNAQWELLEPRGRGRLTAGEYGGVPRAVKYLAYQVDDAHVNGYFAIVKVRLIVQPVLPTATNRTVPPSAVTVDDKWVRVNGTWYRALEQEEGAAGPVTSQR